MADVVHNLLPFQCHHIRNKDEKGSQAARENTSPNCDDHWPRGSKALQYEKQTHIQCEDTEKTKATRNREGTDAVNTNLADHLPMSDNKIGRSSEKCAPFVHCVNFVQCMMQKQR
jgi:hypothetical protein